MPRTGRHIAQRPRRRPSALLLPALLLTSSGGALVALAALPTGPDAVAAVRGGERVETAAGAATARPSREQRDDALAARGALRASRDRGSPAAQAPGAGPARQQRPVDDMLSGAAAPAAPPPPAAAPVPPEFVRPGAGPLTSRFGPRWGRLHTGIDLAAGTGAPVVAAADGVVLSAQTEGGYGGVVRVQHGGDTVTVYAHLSALLVEPGRAVTAGTVLGSEGSTGRSTGPHLHFEVRVAGLPVDPLPWLMARGIDPAQPVAPPP